MRPKGNFVAVVPIISPHPTVIEIERLTVSLSNWPWRVVFMAANDIDFSSYLKIRPDAETLELSPRWFKSKQTYSDLLLRPWFYKEFSDADFMLILQLDALLVAPINFEPMENFDYAGAPWIPTIRLSWNPITRHLGPGSGFYESRRLFVGNGGLSLRRVEAFFRVSRFLPKVRTAVNEDLIYSFFGPKRGLRILPLHECSTLFMETGARGWQYPNRFPNSVGFHGLVRHNPGLERALLDHYKSQ